jgi:hypothetical protein
MRKWFRPDDRFGLYGGELAYAAGVPVREAIGLGLR